MGIDENMKNVIKAVASNDIRQAKKWAYAALDADTTQKNRDFVARYKSILTTEASNLIEVPYNLKDILICEDMSLSFLENRYYVTAKEQEMADQIFRMAKVSLKLMEMQIPYKNATLLYGPPGTGKTLFGKYIAYKMDLPFCYLNFSRVVDSYMGATSKNISQVFQYASSNPCVFMLDEVDTISCNRSGNMGSSTAKEESRMTITLMQEFDRLAGDVVVIAATNRLDLLDEAFISRCPLRYEMTPFSYEERKEMVNCFLADIGMEFSDEEKEPIIAKDEDQRSIIGSLIRKIAEKLDTEERD